MNEIVLLKLSAAIVVFLICYMGIITAYKLKQYIRWFDILSAFSGGILIATAYTHMLPETMEQYSDYLSRSVTEIIPSMGLGDVEMTFIDKCTNIDSLTLPDVHAYNYPLIPFLAALSFIILFLIERGIVQYIHNNQTHTKLQDVEKGPEAPSGEDLGAMANLPELTAFALVVAVSFHAVIEGMGMGSTCNRKTLLSTFIGIAIHKGLEGFAVGASLFEASTRRFVISATIVCLATPLGVLLGFLLTLGNMETGLMGIVLGALAVGTFSQVAMMEFLPRTFANPMDYLWKSVALLAGFGIMCTMPICFAHAEHA